MSHHSSDGEDISKFNKGDVVWAKVSGYPWWPGNTKETDNSKEEKVYLVYFFGDKTHVKLAETKIENFQEKLSENSKTRQKRLTNAIEKAKEYLKEKSQGKKNNEPSSSSLSSELKSSQESNLDNKENINGKKDGSNSSNKKDNKSVEESNVNSSDKDEIPKFLGKKRKIKKNEKEQKQQNVQINININLMENQHNTLNINSFQNKEKCQQECDPLKGEDYTEKKRPDNISESANINNVDLSESSLQLISEEDQFSLDKIKRLKNDIIKDSVDLSSSHSTKNLLNTLNKLGEEIESLSNESSYSNVKEFYFKNKEIVTILHSLTYNKSSEVITKSVEVLEIFNHFFINKLFEWNSQEEKEKNYLVSEQNLKLNNSFPVIDKFSDNLLNEISNFINKVKDDMSQKSVSSKIIKSEENAFKKPIKKTGFDELYDIFQLDSQLIVKEFTKISGEFFKSVYNKNPNLSQEESHKRRRVCLKIMNILKKFLPKINEGVLQKITIFTEYKSRQEDKKFGDKYYNNVRIFCNKLQEIFTNK